ncbi:MAG: serine/threonine protein kinase [Oligoflexia bacterium]|nr:serine/threonine protein kinase [Oligoflexia bacterium]
MKKLHWSVFLLIFTINNANATQEKCNGSTNFIDSTLTDFLKKSLKVVKGDLGPRNDMGIELLKNLTKNVDQIPLCDVFESENKIVPGSIIAEGTYGVVRNVTIGSGDDQKNDYLKVLKESYELDPYGHNLVDFIYEREIMKALSSDSNVSPKIFKSYLCSKIKRDDIFHTEKKIIASKIIMEKMDGSLANLLENSQKKKKFGKKDLKSIFDLAVKMHKKKIVHQDFHIKNILYKEMKGKISYFITDFGGSHLYGSNDSNETSKTFNNFRWIRKTGTLQKQIMGDYEDLLESLKSVGIKIKLKLKKSKKTLINYKSESKTGADKDVISIEVDD